MKTWISAAAVVGLLASTGVAQAGCLTGAAVGGAAGHFAGHHAVLGAIAGCAIGHHQAKKKLRDQQTRSPSQPSTGT